MTIIKWKFSSTAGFITWFESSPIGVGTGDSLEESIGDLIRAHGAEGGVVLSIAKAGDKQP